jgi:hypothetical protein
MKSGKACKAFVYFLCVSFLLLTGGFTRMTAEAKEKEVPIGEMVSKGDVRFEARENQWKNVEPSYFPIFHGIKIRTEKGVAIVSMANNSQVELGPDSTVFFEQSNRLNLSQGNLDFRISPASETSIRVKSLSITLPRPQTASKGPSGASGNRQDAIGSINIHPNGAVTVRSIQGSFSILGHDRTVLATLSPKDMVTIPSATSSGTQKLAQAGDTTEEKKDPPPAGGAVAGAAGGAAAGAAGAAAGTAGAAGLSGLAMLGLGTAIGGALGLMGYVIYENNVENCCCPKCPEPCGACR